MQSLEELISVNMEVTFRCKAAGGADGEFLITTNSEVLPPANESEIQEIRDRMKEHSLEVIEFYKKYGGIDFHRESENGASTLCIHPVQNWDELYSEVSEWFEMIDEDELDESGIDWLESCVVFAEVPSSGNYFLIPTAGSEQGKVIYQDHDGFEPEVYANSFNEFLVKFLSQPIEQVDHLGCYTRYSDGKTNKQWIPVEIVKP
jgi:hypothetical protein